MRAYFGTANEKERLMRQLYAKAEPRPKTALPSLENALEASSIHCAISISSLTDAACNVLCRKNFDHHRGFAFGRSCIPIKVTAIFTVCTVCTVVFRVCVKIMYERLGMFAAKPNAKQNDAHVIPFVWIGVSDPTIATRRSARERSGGTGRPRSCEDRYSV